jgi:type IV secretory pathway TraG/TraD family ATPase VirD4
MKKLPDYSTTICGRNLSILLTAQNINQLFEAYGSFKAKILLGQMKSAVVHPPGPLDNDGAKFIEEALYYTSGFAHSTNEHEGGRSQGENEQRVPLMPADAIKQLAEDEEKVFSFRKGVRPIIAKRLDWREFPELVKRANIPPPEVPDLHPFETRDVNIGIDRLAPVSSWRDDPSLLRHRNYSPAFIEAENPTSAGREEWN